MAEQKLSQASNTTIKFEMKEAKTKTDRTVTRKDEDGTCPEATLSYRKPRVGLSLI